MVGITSSVCNDAFLWCFDAVAGPV